MGHDDERGKGASNSPKPADNGIDPVSELSDLDSAFDSIDDTMKDVPRRDVTVTPEALAQIVNDAVAKAITEYEQARGTTPEPGRDSQGGAAAPNQARVAPRQPANPPAPPLSPWRAKIEQLKGDMGLDEIEFDEPPPEPIEKVIQRELSTQMGVHDFEFEDAPGPAAETDAPTRTEADAIAGWATPVHHAPPAVVDTGKPEEVVAPTPPAPAAVVPKANPKEGVAPTQPKKELAATPPAPKAVASTPPAPVRAPAAAAPPIQKPPVTPKPEVRETLKKPEIPKPEIRETVGKPEARETVSKPEVRETVGKPEVAVSKPEVRETVSKPEVKETRRGLASWFRSAFADTPPAREPERAAAIPDAEAKAAAVPAAPPAPAPPVVAPAPIAKRLAPEEAAKEIVFTFDPIPPIPPRLPREPKEPPKKIKKSGTFL